MKEHKFTVDLTGLELSEPEQKRISGALQRVAMDEVAALSLARGQGVSLELKTKLFPGTHGGFLLAMLKPAEAVLRATEA